LKRAGTIIFAFSVVMWAATHYPKPAAFTKDYAALKAPLEERLEAVSKGLSPEIQKLATSDNDADQEKIPAELRPAAKQFADLSGEMDDLDNAQAHEVLENSAAGRVGRFIAPVFYPLGYDWKTSIGVTGAFFAREVIVSTMGIVYSVGDVEDSTDALQKAMKADVWPAGSARAGQAVWSPVVALSLMVFVVFCMQCLSTLAIAKKETGHWGWPAFMFVYMTGLAWVAAFVVYQGGCLATRIIHG
jgi:ferrous iron transport protein B